MDILEWHQPWVSTVATVNQQLLEQYSERYSYLQPPTSTNLNALSSELRNLTLLIRFGDRTSFKKRGQVLLSLQYPELACGDLYKALQLADVRDEGIIRLLLAQSLFMANSFLECLQLIEGESRHSSDFRTLRQYAQKAFEIEQAEEAARLVSSGSGHDEGLISTPANKDFSGEIVCQLYPWIKESWLVRKPSAVANLNHEIHEQSLGQCKIRPSSINEEGRDCFGLFATRIIPAQSWIFTDETTLCATSSPFKHCDACGGGFSRSQAKLSCCETTARFCSLHCADKARANYHTAICGQKFDQYIASQFNPTTNTDNVAIDRLWVRILASIMQSLDNDKSAYRHPLEVPFINALTAMYGSTVRFSLAQDIVKPLEALQILDIDPYTDLRFDFWVLRIIAARLDTNLREQIITPRQGLDVSESELIAVNSLYAFCNHSCNPNVDLIVDESTQSSTIRLVARRTIREGEELLVSYLDEGVWN